jgi:PPOX class probable F420-dependent enzyme
MTGEEIRAFLAANMKVQVASIGRDGMPHLTTLFYVMLDGRISFWTYARSQKVKNLERDPRVSALVETGTDYAELRGVSVQGKAEVVRDPDEIRRIGTAVVHAMSGGADLGDLGRDIVEHQVKKRVGIVITPDKVASWDHSKMNALPGGAAG